jgi:ubiquitin-protein ligase E3 C
MLGRAPGVEDLPSLDRQLAASLASLLEAARRVRAARAAGDAAAVDEVDALGLTMSVTDAGGGAEAAAEVDLLPGGRDIPVTAANAERYAALFAHHRLNTQISRQVRAFLRGFRELIPLSWLHMFAPHELQLLLSGEEVLDVAAVISDLRANTVLQSGFDVGDPYVDVFWGVVGTFSPAEMRSLLRFVTSVPRPPLLGFATLSPKFGIKPLTSDSKALPVAATCFNMLYLRECAASAAALLRAGRARAACRLPASPAPLTLPPHKHTHFTPQLAMPRWTSCAPSC